jgi:galactonate dehydratase
MKITRVTSYAIKIPRDLTQARGTAGSPAPLEAGQSDYRFIAGIDTALWDIKGKALETRVCDLPGGPFADELPAYISGLSGADDSARIAQAAEYQQRGFNAFKLFMDGEPEALLQLQDGLRERLARDAKLMVDVLWRMGQAEAVRFGRELDARHATWFEAPLKPEDVIGHARLAASIDTPVAMGEC